MSYHRQLSPGGRRIINPARISDSLTDPYYARHGSIASPRASTGVIPISTQTFINVPPPAGTRTLEPRSERLDPYSGRPRRSSFIEPSRGSMSTTQLPIRVSSSRDKDYYPPPPAKEPRKVEYKKVYSVDDGNVKLVADVDIPVTSERQHRRHEGASEKSAHRSEPGRSSRTQYSNGTFVRDREKTVDDDGAYSYTDAAGMFRDTEPRWRDRETRPRRNSMDRTGASRERPASMLVDPSSLYEPRNGKESGPPPSTRGWDKLHDGLGRTRSVRDGQRVVAQSPTRGRAVPHHDPRDSYYVAPRMGSTERHRTYTSNDSTYDHYDYEDRRGPPRRERRNSVTRAADRSVERRGFGIRAESRDPPARGSEDNFERPKSYRDSGLFENQRRDTINEPRNRDIRRDELIDRDVDPRERDWPRDRERERERDRDADRDRERQHRRDTDRDYPRKDPSPRDSNDNATSSGSTLAKVGAGAAAALGLGKLVSKDKSEGSDKDRERDRDRDWERDRDRDRDRPRESHRRYDEQEDDEREQHSRSQESYSDHRPTTDRKGGRDQFGQDPERSLGFAFETPASLPAPGPASTERDWDRDRDREREREIPRDRDREREREFDRGQSETPLEMPKPAVDAEEDYRRRMEQVQRELGRPAEVRSNADVDLDRERRRREREARQRERDQRHSADGTAAVPLAAAGTTATPFPPDLRSSPPVNNSQREFENESDSTSLTSGLRRRPSILDMPMPVPAQIIDNSLSERKENRVRIVDPPTEEDEKKPKGILKRPTEKFPENRDVVREGVAPLKDPTKKGIPPGARWTKIDRRLVNPEALEAAKERYEERQDCVIVLRVLTKEDIQKLADRTREIREQRFEEERAERRAARRRERLQDREDRDEYSDDSELEFQSRPAKMLEAPSSNAGS